MKDFTPGIEWKLECHAADKVARFVPYQKLPNPYYPVDNGVPPAPSDFVPLSVRRGVRSREDWEVARDEAFREMGLDNPYMQEEQ